MGRSTSEEKKTEFVKIRVKPSLKKTIRAFVKGGKYQDVEEQVFLGILVRLGLSVEKEAAKVIARKVSEIAELPPEEREKEASG